MEAIEEVVINKSNMSYDNKVSSAGPKLYSRVLWFLADIFSHLLNEGV